MTLSVEGWALVLAMALVAEAHRQGALPHDERIVVIVMPGMAEDPWLAEFCENHIDAEDAQRMATGVRKEITTWLQARERAVSLAPYAEKANRGHTVSRPRTYRKTDTWG